MIKTTEISAGMKRSERHTERKGKRGYTYTEKETRLLSAGHPIELSR
jgi:hypothetical protein